MICGPEKDLDYRFMFSRVFMITQNFGPDVYEFENIMAAARGLCA